MRLVSTMLVLTTTALAVSGQPQSGGAIRTNSPTFRVTLLGTGSPAPGINRFGASTLVEASGQTLLFDAGRGATIRLNQAGIPLRNLTATFLTNLHSDHLNGLSDVWLTGWLPGPFGGRTVPFQVFGPAGTREMMLNLEKAFAADIRIRIKDENLTPDGIAVAATDIVEGIVFERAGVRVTAFNVDHGEFVTPAFGYRVDYDHHSVVLSGDTRFSTNLIKHAADADVLIHEVMVARREQLATPYVAAGMAHHTNPEETARVFAAVKPRLAVYSHVALFGGSTIDELVSRTRQGYTGPLEVGEDLMQIDVAAAGTPTVRRYARGQ
jgi:ribonuclease Z